MAANSRITQGSDTTPDKFAMLPETIIRDAATTERAFRVYAILKKFAGNDWITWPYRSDMAEFVGCSGDTIKRGLDELTEAGWIELVSKAGEEHPDPTWKLHQWKGGASADDEPPFAMVPYTAIATVSASALRLYALLARYGGNDGLAWPSKGRIHADIGYSPSTTKRRLAELKEAGLITLVGYPRKRRKSNLWKVSRTPVAQIASADVTQEASRSDSRDPADLVHESSISGLRMKLIERDSENETQEDSRGENESLIETTKNAASLRSAAAASCSSVIARREDQDQTLPSTASAIGRTGGAARRAESGGPPAPPAAEAAEAPEPGSAEDQLVELYERFPLDPVDANEAGRYAFEGIALYLAWREAQGLGAMRVQEWIRPIGNSIKQIIRKDIPPRIAIDALFDWHELNTQRGLAKQKFVEPGAIVSTAVMLFESSFGVLHGIDGKGTPRPSDYDRDAQHLRDLMKMADDLNLSPHSAAS